MPRSQQSLATTRRVPYGPARTRRVALAAVALAAAVFWCSTGTARAIVLPMNVQQLTAASSSVVVVTPLKSTSLVAAGVGPVGPRVYNRVPLRVERVLKGSAPPQVLRQPGGTVGATRLVVEDSPTFVPGTRCLVFLDSVGRVVGGFQGVVKLDGAESAAAAVSASDAKLLGQVRTAASGAEVPPAAVVGAPRAPSTFAPSASVVSPSTGSAAVAGVAVASTPAISSVTPVIASAGTNTNVTINGSGFGASQGSVLFYWKYDQGADTPILGAVQSWTDTQIVVTVPTGTVHSYPASADSGPLYVRLADGVTISAPYNGFDVSFGYGGTHWASLSRTFRVNPNTSDLAPASVAALVQSGGQAWDGLSKFSFNYGGTCSTTASTRDSDSDVFWGQLQSGILAQASMWYSGNSLQDADIEFNDLYQWGDGTGSSFDISSIATHEMGHWLGMDDLYGPRDTAKVMYGFAGSGVTKRVPTAGDAAGAAWIYGPPDSATVAVPTFDHVAGSYVSSVDVAMSCSTLGATIRYTTDGTDPTGSSAAYGSPLHITTTTMVKAAGFADGYMTSAVHAATYTIIAPPPPTVAVPTFNPETGAYVSSVDVALSCSTPGATIRYTTDGTDPTASSAVYGPALHITGTTTLKAAGFADGYISSAVHAATYTITAPPPPVVAMPAFSPDGGSFVGSADIAMSCPTPSATIRYTTDGTDPTATSPAYSTPVHLTASATVKAAGFAPGYVQSAVKVANFTITQPPPPVAATPSFTPESGSFLSSVDVTISCDTSAATVRYTTDGTDPTQASAAYSAPLHLTTTTMLKAAAFAPGYTTSAVHAAAYTITLPPPPVVAAPLLSPGTGSYVSSVDVTMSCDTSGATIRYTTDGSAPDEASAAYSAPLHLTATTTVKAVGFAAGHVASPESRATYTITPAPRTIVRIAGADRYGTAIAVSRHAFPGGAPAVVLATGANFPDALAAAPLARAVGGPVLLVKSGGLDATLTAELSRLKPSSVYICGGTGAVRAGVDSAVIGLLGVTPVRLAGATRYGTAGAIAGRLVRLLGRRSTVALATGADYPDALSIAPIAAESGWPILLCTSSRTLPAETRAAFAALNPTNTVVVRSGSAVSANVLGGVPGAMDIHGVDRYATNALAAEAGSPQLSNWSVVVLASGDGFADALVAGPLAASGAGKVLLTPANSPVGTATGAVAAHLDAVKGIEVVGGPAAVSDEVVAAFRSVLASQASKPATTKSPPTSR